MDLNDDQDNYEVIDEQSFAKASKSDNNKNNIENTKEINKAKENKVNDDKFEFDFGDLSKSKPKKNNFKIQNGWIYQSDFKNY